MRSTITLRKKLAVNQRQMASYLGISSSMLAMAEKGLRILPASAILKMAELESAYLTIQKAKKPGRAWLALQPALDKQDNKFADKMLGNAKYHQLKAQILQRKLDKIASTQEQDKLWLGIIDNKLAGMSKNKATRSEYLWLEDQQATVSKRLLKNGNTTQAKLQLQIDLLQASADIHGAYHQKMKK